MNILIITDPGIPVPPIGYGGIERIAALLAEEYLRLGHNVDLLSSEGSHIEGATMHIIGKEGYPPTKEEMRYAKNTTRKFLKQNEKKYDLVHNFGRLVYFLPIMTSPVKKLMTYQREITKRNIQVATLLPHRNLFFTGCSQNLIDRCNPPGKWKAVHNAIRFSDYTLTENLPADAPLMFLGRIEKIKGCHTAIEVATQTGNQLIIAGNISKLPEEIAYFEKEIKPNIDGKQIIFVGEVNDAQKMDWLGKCKALLMPIEWNEPFGIVMIEAMGCGTPVIAFKHGSVGEVVDEGETGFKVHGLEQMVASIQQLQKLDRRKVRDVAEKNFDISVVAKQYLDFVQSK